MLPYKSEMTPESVESMRRTWESIIKIVQTVYQDKGYDLDFRWQIYLNIHRFLPQEGTYMNFESIEKDHEVSWYDDFYLDKYAVLQLDNDFIERVQEHIEDDEWNVDINELKEEILQSGYGSFENNW